MTARNDDRDDAESDWIQRMTQERRQQVIDHSMMQINLCDDEEARDEQRKRVFATAPDRGARPRESVAYRECVLIGALPEEQRRLRRELLTYTTAWPERKRA